MDIQCGSQILKLCIFILQDENPVKAKQNWKLGFPTMKLLNVVEIVYISSDIAF